MRHIYILAAALAAAPAVAQDLPSTEINVVGNLGTSTQSRLLEAPFWTEKVEELSGGAIVVRFRPMNEMGLKGTETFGMLSKGVMNLATGQLGHHSGHDPINDGNDLAGMSTDYDAFEATTAAFFPVLSAYYRDKLGLHLLSLQSYQSQVTYCRTPIAGLADLRGKRVRTSSASQADFVTYLGASSVDMAFGEVQQGLEQGVIDCAITSTVGGYTSRWYEGATHLLDLPINFGAGATAANAQWWDGLDAAVQDFLTTQVEALSDEMWAQNRREDREGIACNTTGPCPFGDDLGRLTLVTPSEADYALQKEAFTEAVLPGWLNRCGAPCEDTYRSFVQLD